MNIRAVKAPSQVLRQTQFTASALLEVSSAREQEVPVELWSGPTRLAAARLRTRAGANTLPWNVQVAANEPGAMPLEFRAGAGEAQQIVACTTQVVERTKVEVLYYQGALQWGYRYLLAALEGDPSFHMTSILNPSLDVRMTTGAPGHAVLPDLPDDARALKPFGIVVLAHVFADRLTDRQQRALTEYARGGGGVLFIAPDTAATQRFAGTALEQMLPVVFEPEARATPRGRSRPALPRTNGGRGQRRRDAVRQRRPATIAAAPAAVFPAAGREPGHGGGDLPQRRARRDAEVLRLRQGARGQVRRGRAGGERRGRPGGRRRAAARPARAAAVRGGFHGGVDDRPALALEDVAAEQQPRAGDVLAATPALAPAAAGRGAAPGEIDAVARGPRRGGVARGRACRRERRARRRGGVARRPASSPPVARGQGQRAGRARSGRRVSSRMPPGVGKCAPPTRRAISRG